MFKPYGRDPASTEPRPTAEKPWPWHRWRELDDAEFLRYLKTGDGLENDALLPAQVIVDEREPPRDSSDIAHLKQRLAQAEVQIARLLKAQGQRSGTSAPPFEGTSDESGPDD